MNHFATPDFWQAYRQLPAEVRELADKNFALLSQDPITPSVRLSHESEKKEELVFFRNQWNNGDICNLGLVG
jgi:hypothetical protein